MRRFYTFKTVRGCKYLCVELLGRFINGPPDIGQHGVVNAVFNLRSRLKTMFFYARRLSNNCVMAI